MRIIIDTCVALDYMQCRIPHEGPASHIFALCCMGMVEGYFTSKSFSDLYYLMHHFLHDNSLTREAISAWQTAIGILDVTGEDCLNALYSPISDYEDAMMAATAEREKIDFIITRNTRDFRNSPVPAITATEFMSLVLKTTQQDPTCSLP